MLPTVTVRPAMHGREYLIQSDRIGMEHRPAAPVRKAVAVKIDDVHVGGAQRNAFFDDIRTFVGHPDGRSNSPTFGHFKLPHPDERVTVQ